MDSSGKVPQFFVNFIGTLYRSIAWAFGKDLPHPLGNRNFCPYFWAVFFTFFVPAGLLPVAVGWALRFTLGKGRGGAITRALKKPLEVGFWGVIAAFVVTDLVLLGLQAHEEGIIKILSQVFVVVIGGVAFLAGVVPFVLAVSFVLDWVGGKTRKALEEKSGTRPALKFLSFPFRVAFSIPYAFWWAVRQSSGLARKGYEARCPIVYFQ